MKILFNVLAKDLANAKAISAVAPERIFVGLMVKNYKTDVAAIKQVRQFMENGILTSVGLGAGDPAMWNRVAQVSLKTFPNHINQVFPAAGYTKGLLEGAGAGQDVIINALVEPAEKPGEVYISTGEISQNKKEAISCKLAAKLIADIGLNSVKFYPIDGLQKAEHLSAMCRAAKEEGIKMFEPTGAITMENVHEIVDICLQSGIKIVMPHLYTSLVDKKTKETKPEYIEKLVAMKW